tara:strand:- start:185 stop:526 length:342 start_codon:yes stop_codon:yes gene_type:complete
MNDKKDNLNWLEINIERPLIELPKDTDEEMPEELKQFVHNALNAKNEAERREAILAEYVRQGSHQDEINAAQIALFTARSAERRKQARRNFILFALLASAYVTFAISLAIYNI